MFKQVRGYWGSFFLIMILNIIISVSTVASAIVAMKMIDTSIEKGFSEASFFIVLFAFIMFAQIFLGAYLSLNITKFKELLSYKMQKQFLNKFFNTEWQTIHKYHNGDIQTRLTSDVNSIVEVWANTFPSLVSLFVQLITAFVTLWYFDSTLALFAFLLGPITVLVSWFIGRKLKKYQHHIQTAESQYRAYLTENVHHSLVIKTFEYENKSMENIVQLQKNKYFWVLKRQMYALTTNISMGIGYRIGFFLAFGIGAFKLSMGTTSFGTFTAFIQLVGQIQGPMEGMSRSLPIIVSAAASVERLREIELLALEVKKTNKVKQMEVKYLTLDNIRFSYEENSPILNGVTLKVNAGEIIAIVGTSGEGKTTLLRLLLNLLQPQEGTLSIYDTNKQEHILSSSTRSYFSYVPQGNTLLSGTIADNIKIGRPTATEDDIIEVAKQACAWDFIKRLPNGLNTRIGEGGSGLSEGQSQRIAIARALLRPSPILLLDEATSALDINTEWDVINSLKQMSPLKTCIAITHRLSVADICDRIFELKDGHLIELEKSKIKI